MSSYILVTGGAGYIGSHTVIELINHGYKVVIVDNLINSSYDAVARIEYIVKQSVPFFNVDLRDSKALSKVFDAYPISGVIHFAALKAVGESTIIPLEYYENNIGGTVSLLQTMKSHNVKTIVFSSSATVYGDATRFENMIPIPEHCPTGPTNPYGKTKWMIEHILKDIYTSDNQWRAAILRYFNPIGAHPSGLLGEDPLGIPNNLLPYLAQVAVGRREKLSIFGNDYDSHDGTPIRDYIHVVDLAKGHIAALNYLSNKLEPKQGIYREWNLGTGKGSTVFDVYHAFCRAVGKELPYEVVGRRDGDVLDLTAVPTRANTELNWFAVLSIDEACKDLWNWTTKNPFGFNVKHYSHNNKVYNTAEKIHTVTYPNFKVEIGNRGATLLNIKVNDKSVICHFDDLKDYKDPSNPFFGATIGRYANRLPKGQFKLDGKEYQVDINRDGSSLHGGFIGFDKEVWYGPIASEKENYTSLKFINLEEDGHSGYPGELSTTVEFKISENSLELEFESYLTKDSKHDKTIVNLTNHNYFNLLEGEEKTINNHIFKLCTDKYLEVNEKLLPTGEITRWTDPNPTREFALNDYVFDNAFVVDEEPKLLDTRSLPLKDVLEVSHPNTKTKLVISTTEPAFQFYTGNFINTKNHGKRSGFACEPSRFISAAVFDNWSNQVVVKKGDTYGSKIKYTFDF